MSRTDTVISTNQSEIFCGIGRALTSSLDPREVFRRVMQLIGGHFSPRNWSLLLVEEGTGRLRFEIAMGVDSERLRGFMLEPGEGIVGWVCEHGEPQVVVDAQTDPRFSSRLDAVIGFKTYSVVCVPLLNGSNKVIGALELINKVRPAPDGSPATWEGEPFTGLDLSILAAIGSFAGVAAENAFLHEKVRELAMLDPLTGLSNRYYFNEVYSREVKRSKRYGHPLCIMMMDVDNLKAINDHHGHLVGDRALGIVGSILKESVRETDLVARFGGDEFVVLLPVSNEESGREVAGRIRERLAAWNENPALPGIRLGLSIGLHAAGPEEADQLLLLADQDLYHSKGRRAGIEEITSEDRMRRYLWCALGEGD